MTILFDVSGQLRTLVWSNNLFIRMKRLTSISTYFPTTTSIFPRWVRGKDNCGRALSNESVAKTTVAKRCPDESVANTTVLDRMVKYVAWHERSTSSLNKARCRSARIQSNQPYAFKTISLGEDSNLEPSAHVSNALPSRRLSTCTFMRKQ